MTARSPSRPSAAQLILVADQLLRFGRFHEALRTVDQSIALDPDSARAHSLRCDLRTRLDWLSGAIESAERSLELRDAPELRRTLIQQHLEFDNPSGALKLALAGLRATPADTVLREYVVEAQIAMRDYEAARAGLESLPKDSERRRTALLACGDLLTIDREAGDDAAGWTAKAEIALWTGRLEHARRHAEVALSMGADAQALTVIASANLYEGRLFEADDWASRAIRAGSELPDPHIIQSAAARRLGDLERARVKFHDALQMAPRYLLALDLTRVAGLDVRDAPDPYEAGAADLALRAPDLAGKRGRVVAERALDALSGNFTRHPTCSFLAGQARRIEVVPDPRSASTDLRRRMRIVGIDVLIDDYGDLVRRYDGHPLVHTHRGELYLWSGRLPEAAADFEAALARSTRTVWAHIGLGLVRLLEGSFSETLEILERGAQQSYVGPTTPAVRGEALRRLGHHEAARDDFAATVANAPGRISAWVNLALLAIRTGRRVELHQALREIEERAPSLLRDLSHDLGHSLSVSRLDALERDLEHMLTMMRGNRSSRMISYYTADGVAHILDSRPKPEAASEAR